ncbi:MAG: aminotransferase class V-fold PLP-dependent enzyme, partial [Flavisolibacter sp.]
MALNTKNIRQDFPILEREVHQDIPLVYLDSTATTQKPIAVLKAMDEFYRQNYANIHRGVHTLAEEATAIYEQSRQKVADMIHAASATEIIFTRNTTESINLVAYTWARAN